MIRIMYGRTHGSANGTEDDGVGVLSGGKSFFGQRLACSIDGALVAV